MKNISTDKFFIIIKSPAVVIKISVSKQNILQF